MSFRDGLRALQKGTAEILPHKVEGNRQMSDAQPLTMQTGKRNLLGIMVGAIVKRYGQCDAITIVIEQRHRVHAAAQNEYTIHL